MATRWLIWGPAAVVIFSASVIAGGLVLFLLPLIAVLYGAFSWVGWSGPDARA